MKTAPADWSQSEVSNQGAEFVAQRHESFIEKKNYGRFEFSTGTGLGRIADLKSESFILCIKSLSFFGLRNPSKFTKNDFNSKFHCFTQEKAIKFDKANQYKYAADAYERVVSTIQKSLYIDERLNQKGKVGKLIT